MRLFRSMRWLLLALLLPVIPASQAHAGVFISVGFAPPVMPVYVQPVCPEPNLMWSPGYWAYGDEGYYWVPGAWVPAPYVGALWTPPYWGFEGGAYLFHAGYWGPHVGYYGGVNYGFGYMGIGFAGGEWRGGFFAYNTAVVHVNETVIRNVYVDRTVVERTTIVNDRHVAYAGGPGGINHQPTQEERAAMQERHVAATPVQQQHMQAARADKTSYFNANHGHPQNVAMARPMATPRNAAPAGVAAGAHANTMARPSGGNVNANANARGEYRTPATQPNNRPAPETRSTPEYRPTPQSRPAPETRSAPEYRPTPQSRPAPETRSAPQSRPAPESRPQSRPAPESRPAPQSHPKEPKR